MVEFALVLPLTLLLIDGVMEFSMVMYDKAVITNAAREAVRAGMVMRDPKMSNADIAAIATQYASQYVISFGRSDVIQVVVTQSVDSAYQTPLSVMVTYTYTSLLTSGFFSAIQQPVVLSSTVSFLNE